MWGPPRGYDDLIGDAANAAPLGDPVELEVPGVGAVWARHPQPRSAATLAAITRPGLSLSARSGLMVTFVTEHLGEQQVDDLLDQMMGGELPDDTMGRISRGLCRWGTARPYNAVTNLAGITGQHWRTIRQHLLANGVTDPMALPSMHALLDVTEQMVIESMTGTSEAVIRMKRDDFYNQLYRPDPDPSDDVNGEDYRPVPEGFEDGEDDAAFDRFAATVQ